MRQIINVQILRPALTRQISGALDEFRSKSLPRKIRMHGWIKQKRVFPAVAGGLHETGKRSAAPRGYVQKAGAQTLLEIFGGGRSPARSPKHRQVVI